MKKFVSVRTSLVQDVLIDFIGTAVFHMIFNLINSNRKNDISHNGE